MALFNWLLLSQLLLLTCSIQFCRASHNSMKVDELNGEPEDLLLEELVRSWKKARAQQSQDLLHRIQEEQLHAGHNRAVHSPADIFQHKFGYRPHEAAYHQPIPRRQFNPVHENANAVSGNVHRFGQKEKVDAFDAAQTQPDAEYFQLETKMGDIEGNSKYPRPMPGDAVRLTEARFRDPVAHAVKSSTTSRNPDAFADIYLTALVAGCSASAVAAMLAFGVCFYRWQGRVKSAQDVEYPAYGITGPGPSANSKGSLKSSPTSGWIKPPKSVVSGDKKLAHSAHMFHFQHQKQQVIAMESHSGCDRRTSNSGGESDEDNEEGDYTVYECPGLAPTGEMEVKNPLFLDDPTPATPAAKRQGE